RRQRVLGKGAIGGKIAAKSRSQRDDGHKAQSVSCCPHGLCIPRASGRNTPPANFELFVDFVNYEVWQWALDPQLSCPYISPRWSRRLHDIGQAGDQSSHYLDRRISTMARRCELTG